MTLAAVVSHNRRDHLCNSNRLMDLLLKNHRDV